MFTHRSILDELARDTWGRLRDARALGVRFGEETITDLLLLDLKRRGPRGLQFVQTSKYLEKTQGTDFEWWIGSDASRWLRFAVQAKRIQHNGRYHGLTHKVGSTYQIDLLESFAKANRARPLYSFYNHVPTIDEKRHWHCCRSFEPEQLGVSIALPATVRATFKVHGAKNFSRIHRDSCSLPWRCLAQCPRAKALIRGSVKSTADQAWGRDLLDGEGNSFLELPPEIARARETGQPVSGSTDASELQRLPKRILIYDIDSPNEPQD